MEKRERLLSLVKQMELELQKSKEDEASEETDKKIVAAVKEIEGHWKKTGTFTQDSETKTFTMKISDRLHQRIKLISRISNESMQDICEEALSDWLKKKGFDE